MCCEVELVILIVLFVNIMADVRFKRATPELKKVTRIEPIRSGKSSGQVSCFM